MDTATILSDLDTWCNEADADDLCSDFSPMKETELSFFVESDRWSVRHEPGRSFVVVKETGRIEWFVVSPKLSQTQRKKEVKDIFVWLNTEDIAEVYYGRVGDTTFSRWLWQDELQATWNPLSNGMALVTVPANKGRQWANIE